MVQLKRTRDAEYDQNSQKHVTVEFHIMQLSLDESEHSTSCPVSIGQIHRSRVQRWFSEGYSLSQQSQLRVSLVAAVLLERQMSPVSPVCGRC